MSIRLIIISFLCSCMMTVQGAEQLFTQQPTMMPKMAISGEHSVGVKTFEVVNPQQLNLTDFESLQDRQLTLEVWYPAQKGGKLATYENVTRLNKAFAVQGEAYRDAKPQAQGDFPLVVLSHGYTGYRTIMFYLGEHLASHGYVVVGIDHTDSTNEDVDFNNNPGSGFVSTLINRARDQQFVLDYFSKSNHEFSEVTNTDYAAVIGYSMGGFGAINTVGGCYDFNSAGLQRLGFPEQAANAMLPLFNFCRAGLENVDNRWKAMISFAPWGQELNVHSAASLAQINVPTLYIAGENDDISGYEMGVKKLYEQTGGENTFMLVYENARHNFAPHPAPKVAFETDIEIGHYIEPAWSNEALTRINEHFALSFLNCYVKSHEESCQLLPTREDATQLKDAQGKLSEPWPGFPERWGTGMQFYSKKVNE